MDPKEATRLSDASVPHGGIKGRSTAGIFVWLQIIENLLLDSAPAVSLFMPGTLGEAISGQRAGALHTPALGALLLALYAAAAVTGEWVAATRRDFA